MSDTIVLTKGQKIDLSKRDGTAMTHFSVGCNWGAIESGGFLGFGKKVEAVDLDASAICFDANGNPVDTVYYAKLNSDAPGFIRHSGDDRSGDVGGDDGRDNETITVDLTKAPANVDKIAFVLVSFRGHDFAKVPHAGLKLYEGSPARPGEVAASYNVTQDPRYAGRRAMYMGHLYRRGDSWRFQATGDATADTSLREVAQTVRNMLLAG